MPATTHVPNSTNDPKNFTAETHAIVRVGKALLNAGAGSYRVRQSMEQVAAALGINWLQSHVTLSELTVTVFKGTKFRTQTGQVHSVGVNTDKLTELQNLATTIQPGTTPAEVEARLNEIDARGYRYGRVMNGLWCALGCAAFAFLNNGDPIDMAAAFIGAGLGQLLRITLLRRRFNQYIATGLGGTLAVLAYAGFAYLVSLFGWGPPSAHEAGMVAAVLFIVPGFPLVTAVLDLAKSDFVGGLSRLAYAAIILAAGAIPLLVVSWMLNIAPTPLPPLAMCPAWLWMLRAMTSFVGIFGFASMLNAPWRIALAASLFGTITNVERLFLLEVWHWPELASAGLSTLTIGLFAAAVAAWRHRPTITMTVPATLIMVPGTAAFRALYWFVHDSAAATMTSQGSNIDLMFSNLSTASLRIFGMGLGLVVARVLTDRRWTFDKRHALEDLIDPPAAGTDER